MRTITVALFSLSLLSSTLSFAQPQQNKLEKMDNQAQKSLNRAERKDDRMDLRELQNLLVRMDQAVAVRSPGLLSDVDSGVLRALHRELGEDRTELYNKSLEAQRSTLELTGSQVEARRDGAYLAPPPVMRDDLRDASDDRRDLAEDRIDLAREQNQHLNKRSLAQQYRSLAHQHYPRAVAQKRAILVQLIDLARIELGDDNKERKEDRIERAEDKHERREDRRMGH